MTWRGRIRQGIYSTVEALPRGCGPASPVFTVTLGLHDRTAEINWISKSPVAEKVGYRPDATCCRSTRPSRLRGRLIARSRRSLRKGVEKATSPAAVTGTIAQAPSPRDRRRRPNPRRQESPPACNPSRWRDRRARRTARGVGRGRTVTLVAETAGREHSCPGRGSVRVAERTVYSWARCYREGGLEALGPRRRRDSGTRRVISDPILERAIALRKELPTR